jgi:hypothetical protein
MKKIWSGAWLGVAIALMAIAFVALAGAHAAQVEAKPTKLATAQQSDQPHDMWGGLLDFVEKVAWPLTALWILFVFRDPLLTHCPLPRELGRR